jgi:hypothetical protein
MTIKKASVLIILMLYYRLMFSQSIQRSAFVSGAGVTSSLSLQSNIGELIVNTLSSSPNIITQGFIQNDEFFLSTNSTISIKTGEGKVFPNPVSTFLNLELDCPDFEGISIEVFDVFGKRQVIEEHHYFKSNKIVCELNFENMNSGIFFIKVISAYNQFNKVFKITKVR